MALAKAVAVVMAVLPPVWVDVTFGTDKEVLRPRVPAHAIEEARRWTNPFEPSEVNIEKGRAIFLGKAFCATCHGRDGRGLGEIQGLRGKLPRDFTDRVWQSARSDGELFWILKNGSPGTDMAPFVPLVLTEEEAWQVLLFVRSLGK
jgi:mono/diheme cytochrome c family protein